MDSILGALFAVMIGLMVTVPTVGYMHHGQVSVKEADTAAEMKVIDNAAEQYIQANYAAVEAAATASSPATITVPMLESTGYLSSAVASENPYLQNWQVQVLQPTAGNLQALVMSTGGSTIPAEEATAIAAQVGQEGGFLPYSGEFGAGTGPGNAIGSYGNWGLPMTNYTNPGQGHLVALLAFNNGNLENDYLYRVAVPGQPQLNTMATNLGMGGNNIENVVQNANVAPGTPPSTVNGIPQGVQFGTGTGASAIAAGPGGNMGVYAPGGNLYVYGSQSGGSYANGTINSQNVTAGPGDESCNKDADGHCIGQIAAAGTTENDMPANWSGGVTSHDFFAENGTLAAGPSGQLQAMLSDYANGAAGGGALTLYSPSGSPSSIAATASSSAAIFAIDGGEIAMNDTSGGGPATGGDFAVQSPTGNYVIQATTSNTIGALNIYRGYLHLNTDTNGACDSNSRIWLDGSSIADGCDGNLYALPGGGTGSYVITNGSFHPGAVATQGAGCMTGAIGSNSNGSGQLMECYNGTWRPALSAFTNSYQMGVSNGAQYSNSSPGPMFVSSYCNATPNSSGYMENVTITVYNSSGGQVSTSQGQVAEGGSDANFNAAPSASAMIPSGWSFAVSGHDMSCSLMVTE